MSRSAHQSGTDAQDNVEIFGVGPMASNKTRGERPPLWTACHLSGRRPWFVCSVSSNGRYCGRRVAVLYGAGELFACRNCHGLAYASQQESPRFRSISRSREIRVRLGGTPNLRDPSPKATSNALANIFAPSRAGPSGRCSLQWVDATVARWVRIAPEMEARKGCSRRHAVKPRG
jgi:hypothetical protein